jgi:hypothetical protein
MDGGGASAETFPKGRRIKRMRISIKIFLKFNISISFSVQPWLNFEIAAILY